MSDNLKLGGHRGLGCTDHDKYQAIRDIANLPVENTKDSIVAAFTEQGADYIETDAVMSSDKILFTIHNVVPKDHFFGASKPDDQFRLNKMNFTDIAKYKTGRHNNGAITPFLETLDAIAAVDPKTLPWVINIEIKGVQGSGQNYEDNGYLDILAETVKESKIPADRVLWSSFSLQNIITMSQHFPQSHYGMLFAEQGEVKPIYADHREDFRYQYLQFDHSSVLHVQDTWKAEAHKDAKLGYMHPEILTVTKQKIDVMGKRGLGINAWALFENIKEEGRLDLYKRLAKHAVEKDVPFTVITDYLPEMKALEL
jgi:glycerophosphoryl diester phosphodiesterase